MRMRFLLSVCGILGVLAVIAVTVIEQMLLFNTETLSKKENELVAGSIQGTALTKTSTQAGSEQTRPVEVRKVVVHSDSDNHFYINVRIDGKPIRTLVDTGSSLVALRESDAKKVGLRTIRSDFSLPLATANGLSYGAQVTLRRVEYRSIKMRDVGAVVLPDARLSVSLLGNTFLNRLQSFQVRDDRLILEY